jgi:hypothetical protein
MPPPPGTGVAGWGALAVVVAALANADTDVGGAVVAADGAVATGALLAGGAVAPEGAKVALPATEPEVAYVGVPEGCGGLV